MEDRKYIGKGKAVGNFGGVLCGLCLEDIKQYATVAKNGKHYINFIVQPMKKPDQYDKTHTLYVAEFDHKTKPEKELEKATQKELEQYGPEVSGIPF